MKIEDYLTTLPESILSGQDVQLPDQTFRNIFKFASLGSDDIFCHLGCGNGRGLLIAKEEFGAKNVIGIDNSKEKIDDAAKLWLEKDQNGVHLIVDDVLNTDSFYDANVILFWFVDEDIVQKMMKKFEKLNDDVRIITLWGPLPGCLPESVDFPFIINQKPFKKAKDLQEQLLAVLGTKCVDFVTAWEFAERYTNAISPPNSENNRFVTIVQSLMIWINAKKLGVTCGDGIPEPIKNYMSILREYFNIEIEHLLK